MDFLRHEVSEDLVAGSTFITWAEHSESIYPVFVKADPKKYILIVNNLISKQTKVIDVATIRNVITGERINIPRNPQVRESCSIGPANIPLQNKSLSILFGPSFIPQQLSTLNLVSRSTSVIEEWYKSLMDCITDKSVRNLSAYDHYEKLYAKLIYGYKQTEQRTSLAILPVKSIVKFFAKESKDKESVIIKALKAVGLPTSSAKNIYVSDFAFEKFFFLCNKLVERTDVSDIFKEVSGKDSSITSQDFMNFIVKEQFHHRSDQKFHSSISLETTLDIISQCEHNALLQNKGRLSEDGFLRFLLSSHNEMIDPSFYMKTLNMNQPLNNYFINSSHNTYLTGHQLKGQSSSEMYRLAILSGCRCVELDTWDSKKPEPEITHGNTLVHPVSFYQVIDAINSVAFKGSPYPLILSFEDHCSEEMRKKMVQYMKRVFKEKLLTMPLENYPLVDGGILPSPNDLKYKILVKNKTTYPTETTITQIEKSQFYDRRIGSASTTPSSTLRKLSKDLDITRKRSGSLFEADGLPSRTYSGSFDNKSSYELSEEEFPEGDSVENELAVEDNSMASVVNYIKAVKFDNFTESEATKRFYECSSFNENKALSLIQQEAVEFLNYNRRQLSRIYPKAHRIDSTNYNPYIFWNVGCQMAALNFQTLDVPMQLNLAIFEYTNRWGYYPKPTVMCDPKKNFDPFSLNTIDGVVAASLTVTVLSTHILCELDATPAYCMVEMFGLPSDTIRGGKTKAIWSNGFQVIFDKKPVQFNKIILPAMAFLRLTLHDTNNRMLAHYCCPVAGIKPGYRHFVMRNECFTQFNLVCMFVLLKISDFVPRSFEEIADALSNPIAYLSAKEKRGKQLEALVLDEDNAPESQDKITAPSVLPLIEKSLSTTDLSTQGIAYREKERAHGGSVKTSLPAAKEAIKPQKPLEKTDFVATSMLNEPSIIERLSVSNLKKNKSYLKLMSSLCQELEGCQKKFLKLFASFPEYVSYVRSSTTASMPNIGSLVLLKNFSSALMESDRRSLCQLYERKFSEENSISLRYNDRLYALLDKLLLKEYDASCAFVKKIYAREEKIIRKKLHHQHRLLRKIGSAEASKLNTKNDGSCESVIADSVAEIRKLEKLKNSVLSKLFESKQFLDFALHTEKDETYEKIMNVYHTNCAEIQKIALGEVFKEVDL